MLAFLLAYQAEHQRTRAFCERLAPLDLLESAQANVSMHSGERTAMTGLLVVNRERLRSIGDADLGALGAIHDPGSRARETNYFASTPDVGPGLCKILTHKNQSLMGN